MKKKVMFLAALLALMAVGAFAQTASDFVFVDRGDYIQITGYKGSATDVKIPAMINNKPVTQLSREGFLGGDKKIKSVTIPASVTNLGERAFSGCTVLSKVTIEGAPILESGAFGGCRLLLTVTFASPIPSDLFIGAFDGDLVNAMVTDTAFC